MQARVTADGPAYPVTACGGYEFCRHEWRTVPAGREDEADANPYLETRVAEEEAPARSTAQESAPSEVASEPTGDVTGDEYPVHTGGGWYVINDDGDTIQGKEAALAATSDRETTTGE